MDKILITSAHKTVQAVKTNQVAVKETVLKEIVTALEWGLAPVAETVTVRVPKERQNAQVISK
jgi:hypothetical protein